MNNNATRRRRIFALALPVIAGMLSQNVMSLVDVFLVSGLGNAALAAAGIGAFFIFLCQAITLGASAGVQALTARRFGAGHTVGLLDPLNTALLVLVVIGPVWSTLLYFAVPTVLPWLNDDPQVLEQLVPYVQWRVWAFTFVGMNFAFRGYWTAIDRSGVYLRTLLLMHGGNIVLNAALIYGLAGLPELGLTGAGIGTLCATIAGTMLYFARTWQHARGTGFLRHRLQGEEARHLATLSLPYGVQQVFFAAGFTALFWIIGVLGTAQLAAANVIVNIMLVAFLPGVGMGIAAATLVGQAYGRGDVADARAWAWDVVRLAVVVLAGIGVPMWLAPEVLLGVFLDTPETIALARTPLQIIGLALFIDAFGLVLMHALHGVGYVRQATGVSVSLQWVFFLPVAYVVGPVLGGGLVAIWIVHVLYRAAQAGIFAWMWHGAAWQRGRGGFE